MLLDVRLVSCWDEGYIQHASSAREASNNDLSTFSQTWAGQALFANFSDLWDGEGMALALPLYDRSSK